VYKNMGEVGEMYIVIVNESPRPGIEPQGVGCIAEDQEAAYKEAGHRTLMIYPEPKNGCKKNVREGDFLLQSARVPGFTMALPRRWVPKTFSQLLVEFSEDRPDLIILNSPHQAAGMLALVAKILDIPYFLWIHTDLERYAEVKASWGTKRIATRIVHGLAKKIAYRAALTIFPSNNARDKFVKRIKFTGKTFVLPGCVEPAVLMPEEAREKFDESFRMSNGLPLASTEYPILHMTGRVGPEKNVAFALEVFAELACLCRDPYRRAEFAIRGITTPILVLVGSGSWLYTRKMRKLANSYGVSDLFFPIGKRSRREVRELNKISRGCFCPSIAGTQELVALEAAADGCVVAYVKGEAPEEFLGSSMSMTLDPFQWAFRWHDLLKDSGVWQEKADSCREAVKPYTDKSRFAAQLRCLLWLHTMQLD
jgi:glycosyltransferase involved in cell wall biosynthesis